MDPEARSLKSTFTEAEKKRLSLQNSSDTTSTTYRDTLQDAVQGYKECLEQIRLVSLFSPNESAEDISTFDLPYLLVNYHLADLVQRQPSSSPHARKHVLSASRAAYERFLGLSDGYGLLQPPHAKLFARYGEDPDSFSVASAGADPAARRDAKIANFRAEKDLRQKLEFLRQRPGYADPDAFGGGGDEDVVRSVHLAHLEYCAHMTFQALESLNRELEILAQAPPPAGPEQASPSAEEDERRRRGRTVDGLDANGYGERLDGPIEASGAAGPLLSREGKPLRPFTILGDRQEMARNVFRPSHNLPTMTIDEYLEEERRRGGIIEGGGEASMRVPEPDEDDMDKADAETMKAREWDEFTEANPKGSGNTLNRG